MFFFTYTFQNSNLSHSCNGQKGVFFDHGKKGLFFFHGQKGLLFLPWAKGGILILHVSKNKHPTIQVAMCDECF